MIQRRTLPEQKPEQSAPAEEADAPDTKIVRFPAQAKRFPEEKEEKPPKNPADFTGQTIRFTPIREEQAQQAEKPKIWTYQAEPDPEPAPPSDPKEAKKAARRAQRAQKEAQKRRRQLERHQKQQAKRAERRREQPERDVSDCRAAYAYYAQGTFRRLRLFVSILLALVSPLLDRPWPRALGAELAKISYAVFLVHHVLIQDMASHFDLAALSRRDTAFLFIIYLAAAFAAAKALLWLQTALRGAFAKLRPQT